MSSEKPGIKSKLLSETKAMLLIFIYLALLLCALTTYRKLVLEQYHIGYFQYGFSIVEALVLSKVILLGHYLRVGERFRNSPLIVPTLYKTVCFTVFVLVFSVVEHMLGALIHERRPATAVGEIVSLGEWEILARVLMLFLAFIPMFAVWEVGRLFEEGKLFQLFFKRRTSLNPTNSASLLGAKESS